MDARPGSLPAAKRLADAYVDYSRQVGDAHYAGYAEAVIAPWVRTALPPADALVTQTIILQYRHQFSEARNLLQKTLKIDPRNAQAWLTLATLDMVQGDYQAAAKGCAEVSNAAGIEIGLGCLGSLRAFTGHARQSLAILHQLETASRRASASYNAWVQGLQAESAERLGDWPLAETHYRNALKLQPRDNFLLVAYADFLLDRARPEEVMPLLADHTQSDTAFLRLALAQSALHSDQVKLYTWIMAARFEALRLRGSDYFGREESRFALAWIVIALTIACLARSSVVYAHSASDAYLTLTSARSGGAGNICTIEPKRQMIDNHADGAYVALFFEALCAHVPRKLTLQYTLFFTIDPSHRGFFVMRVNGDIATAVLSPENAKIDLSF